MRTLREWMLRAFRTGRSDDDLAEELRLHAELASEAGRPATMKAGGSLQAMEALRDQRGLRWVEDLVRDVRHALRTMRRTPGFTAVALLTLALGIGANAAVFTVMNAALFKALPVRDPQSLVLFGSARGYGVAVGQLGESFQLYSHDLYTHLRGTNALDALFAVQSSSSLIAVRRDGWDASQPARAKFVSGSYFPALGVNPLMGRAIAESDDARSASPVAVVSYRYWLDTLNADPSIIGDTIDVNGVSVVLVGVAPSGFVGETVAPDPPAFWLPIAAMRVLEPVANLVDEPDRHWLYLMGRLRPEDAEADAEARLTGALRNWLLDRRGPSASAEIRAGIAESRVDIARVPGGVPRLRHSHSDTLWMLLGISATVLFLVCANLAGLLLARELGRRAERSLRLALGATRGRLVRQSLAESLTLALAGGALALLVGAAAARLLIALAFAGAEDVPMPTIPDARVLAFTFALSCGAAVLFGALPAIRPRGGGIATSMKDARFRLGKVLVVGQVALSVVMLAAAGTLAYTLANLSRQTFGFDPDRVLVVSVEPRLARYTYDRLGPLYEQIEAKLTSLPGVTSTGFAYYSPFHECCWAFDVTVPGYTPGEDENSVLLNRVSRRYFETIGTRVLRGRAFTGQDSPAARPAAVVNEAFARRYFQDVNPIGRTFRVVSQPDVDLEIVGIVEDAKYDGPREAVVPMAFLPLLQMRPQQPVASGEYQSNFISTIQVRTAGDPAAMAPLVRRALAEIDPALPVLRMETIADHVEQGLGRERLSATLAGVFSLLALGLTCLGAYGVMAYLVERRTKEIGLRMALGAARGSVIASIMREVMAQAAVGILVGVPVAFAALRLIQGQLYGLIDVGPAALLAVIGLLGGVLALAGYLPARRASRLDPNVVLRAE